MVDIPSQHFWQFLAEVNKRDCAETPRLQQTGSGQTAALQHGGEQLAAGPCTSLPPSREAYPRSPLLLSLLVSVTARRGYPGHPTGLVRTGDWQP